MGIYAWLEALKALSDWFL